MFDDGLSELVIRDYVCACCHSELVRTPADGRLWEIACPKHGNVETCGRVSKYGVERADQQAISDYLEIRDNFSWLLPARPKRTEQQILAELGFGELDMPIYGLTDQESYGFKELGRIKKGGPKQKKRGGNGREYEIMGKDLDHFRVVFNLDLNAEFSRLAQERFIKAYGGLEPDRINFFLPFSKIDRSWSAFYEFYKAGGRYGSADGKRWLYYRDYETNQLWVRNGEVLVDNEFIREDENGLPYMPFDPRQPVYRKTNSKGEDASVYAKPVGRLKVIVPECSQINGLTLETHGVYDIMGISERLRSIADLAERADRSISAVPLVMSRQLRSVPVPLDDGGRVRQNKWLVEIEPSPAWAEKYINYLQMAFFQEGVRDLADLDLPSEAYDDSDDDEQLAGEPEGNDDVKPAAPESKPAASKVTANDFWAAVYDKLKWDRRQGQEVLDASHGDFAAALESLNEQIPA